MYRSNFIDLLKTFTPKEFKELGLFISSKKYNSRKGVVKLYDAVKKFHPDFEHKNFTKEKVFEKLFPGKKFNDATLRPLFHFFSELTEKFISLSQFELNKWDFNINLLDVLVDRKQYALSEKILKESFKDLQSIKRKDDKYYYNKYRFEYMNYFFLTVSNEGVYEKILDKINFETLTGDITNYHLISCLRLWHTAINVKRIYDKPFNEEAFNDFYSKIDINFYAGIPLIEIYYYMIKMQIEKNDADFYKLKELLNKYKKELDEFDLSNTYINLGNYCARRKNEGETHFLKERFEIYKGEINEKTYLINGYMSPKFFCNAVRSGLQQNEILWVKIFIDKYKSELSLENRNVIYSYCLAFYHFRLGEYETALVLLAKINFKEYYMKLEAKLLQIMLYYEMNSHESLISALDSFRHFVAAGKSVSKETIAANSNFARCLNRLIAIRNKFDEMQFDMLKDKLSGNNIANREWLLEKFEELSAGRN